MRTISKRISKWWRDLGTPAEILELRDGLLHHPQLYVSEIVTWKDDIKRSEFHYSWYNLLAGKKNAHDRVFGEDEQPNDYEERCFVCRRNIEEVDKAPKEGITSVNICYNCCERQQRKSRKLMKGG